MKYTKGKLEYEGKAKRIYQVPESDDLCWIEFKDSMTAFNGEKKEELNSKGVINKKISSLIFNYLEKNNIKTRLFVS